MRDAGIATLVFPCGATTLVVLASWVDVVDELAQTDSEVCDVLPLLGLGAGAAVEGRLRRAVRLRSGLWLAMGYQVFLRTIPPSAFAPVPAWLGQVADRTPVASVVRLEPGFGFEVDVARLVHGIGEQWA